MLESPQKKPRLYGVTAFNSHAKNGMEADEVWEREGGEAGKNKRWFDECLRVCGVCNKDKRGGERTRYRDTPVLKEHEASCFKECQSSGDMISRFPGDEEFHT